MTAWTASEELLLRLAAANLDHIAELTAARDEALRIVDAARAYCAARQQLHAATTYAELHLAWNRLDDKRSALMAACGYPTSPEAGTRRDHTPVKSTESDHWDGDGANWAEDDR